MKGNEIREPVGLVQVLEEKEGGSYLRGLLRNYGKQKLPQEDILV